MPPKSLPPPSYLSQVLQQLKRPPRLTLQGVKSLKLTYAWQNDHYSAKHFAKEELPRIRYANPNLNIEVNKVPKTKEEKWDPELALEFEDGTSHKMILSQKWSSTIVEELMNISGGPSWEAWKSHRLEQGLPLLEGGEGARMRERMLQERLKAQAIKENTKMREDGSLEFAPTPGKTGAAAVLP